MALQPLILLVFRPQRLLSSLEKFPEFSTARADVLLDGYRGEVTPGRSQAGHRAQESLPHPVQATSGAPDVVGT